MGGGIGQRQPAVVRRLASQLMMMVLDIFEFLFEMLNVKIEHGFPPRTTPWCTTSSPAPLGLRGAKF